MPTPLDRERTAPPSPASEQPATSRGSGEKKPLPEAAARALAEAAARRSEAARGSAESAKSPGAKEIGGRGGPDPTRYGDWEVNGLASDF